MLLVDGFATFFRALVIVVGLLVFLTSGAYLRRERTDAGEYYALLLFCWPDSASWPPQMS